MNHIVAIIWILVFLSVPIIINLLYKKFYSKISIKKIRKLNDIESLSMKEKINKLMLQILLKENEQSKFYCDEQENSLLIIFDKASIGNHKAKFEVELLYDEIKRDIVTIKITGIDNIDFIK